MSERNISDDLIFRDLVTPIVDYLCVRQPLEAADIIFVFGSLKLPAVWRHAAELYERGCALKILVAGGVGAANAGERSRFGLEGGLSEAGFIRSELVGMGIPQDSVLTEESSTNTLENVVFGMRVLKEFGIVTGRLLLVAKPFHMRRCLATLEWQFPSVKAVCTPPEMGLLDMVDRPRMEFTERILGELDRLRIYADKGDISRQEVPKDIEEAAIRLRSVLEGR